MTGQTTNRLPAVVTRVGGALEVIAQPSELAKYSDYSDQVSTVALGRIVEAMPELNTEDSVGKLVDVLGYHGVNEYKKLQNLVSEFGMPTVHLSMEVLYDNGSRSRGEIQRKHLLVDDRKVDFTKSGVRRDGMKMVENVCQLIQDLRDVLGSETVSDEVTLADTIEKLGGMDNALEMSADTMLSTYYSEEGYDVD